MKKSVFYVIALLLLSLFLAVLPISGEEGIYDSVIRLHVIAASDSEEDQSLKLRVRDEILEEYSARLGAARDLIEAEAEVAALCGEIKEKTEAFVRSEGYSYTVRVEYGEEEYPTREYGEYRFPAGSYRSLRVVIGEGEGQNWWCVLFPPLCLDMACEDDALAVGLSPEEYAIIAGDPGDSGYRVRFKTLELLEGIFSRRRK
ncbi:MAG: stage II sporulation protein R [Clostridia bacterium]|nr:stage II sporulation protein R [Clostridia bacterium]